MMGNVERELHCVQVCQMIWVAGKFEKKLWDVPIGDVLNHNDCVECALTPEQKRDYRYVPRPHVRIPLAVAKKIASGDLGFDGWQYGSGEMLTTSHESVTSWP